MCLVGATAVATAVLMLQAFAVVDAVDAASDTLTAADRADIAVGELRFHATDGLVGGDVDAMQRMASAARRAVEEHGMTSVVVSADGSIIYSIASASPADATETAEDVRASGMPADDVHASLSPEIRSAGSASTPDDLGTNLLRTPAAERDVGTQARVTETFESAAVVTTPLGHAVRVAASFVPVDDAATGEARRVHLIALVGAAIGILSVPTSVVTMVSRGRTRRRLHDREAQVDRMARAADAERRRLAAAVHDGALQDLAGVSLGLAHAAAVSPASNAPLLSEMSTLTRRTMQNLRSLLSCVYTDEVPVGGWTAGLADVVEELRASGVHVTIEADEVRLGPEQHVILLRVAREALRNVHKHASATRASVTFTAAHRGRDCLLVVDDGVGFDPGRSAVARAEGHFGLQFVRDAARDAGALLEIDSRPGRGTTVRLELERMPL